MIMDMPIFIFSLFLFYLSISQFPYSYRYNSNDPHAKNAIPEFAPSGTEGGATEGGDLDTSLYKVSKI